jgi:exopolysaccharide biosynthesis polyprenyl glycosylphosphotransferase
VDTDFVAPELPGDDPNQWASDLGFYRKTSAGLGEQTLRILERRRQTAVVKRRGWLVRRALLAADLIGLTTGFFLAQLLYAHQVGVDHVPTQKEIFAFLLSLPGWVFVAKLYKLYDRDEAQTDHTTPDEIAAVFHLVTVCTWTVYAITRLSGIAHPQVAKVVAFWVISIPLIAVARALARAVVRRRITYLQNTVIVGGGLTGQLIARKLLQHPEYGVNLIGFVDRAPLELGPGLEHLALLDTPESLPTLVRLFDVERVIIAFSQDSHELTLDLIRSLKDLDIHIDVVSRYFEVVAPGMGIHTVEGVPMIGIPPLRLSHSSRLIKRVTDIVGATLGLLLMMPLLVMIAIAIRLDTPGPVFFRQIRRGYGEGVFEILKFRTMVSEAEELKSSFGHLNIHAQSNGDPRMFKIPNDPRITRVGAILRRYSLDELPQLLNVLKGDMSLVGPRPLILEEDEHVEKWARNRLALKPGITGLWQVLGRSTIPFGEMTRLDYLYVTNWSLGGDLRLLMRTLPVLFGSRGAY